MLNESGQCVADRFDRVGIFGAARRTLFFEIGPLTHYPSPFDVGVANNFRQKIIRSENLLAVTGQDDQRLFKIVEQEFASLNLWLPPA